jgi:hypothetical protein
MPNRAASRRSREGSDNGRVRPRKFSMWLKRQQGRDDTVSDLAAWVVTDEHFPDSEDTFDYFEWSDYLPPNIRGCWHDAWNEYKELRKATAHASRFEVQHTRRCTTGTLAV